MKIHKTPFCLILFLLLFCFQSAKAQREKLFTIEGVIDTVANIEYPIFYYQDGIEHWDTIRLDKHSKFSFSAKINEPTQFFFVINNNFNSQLVPTQLLYSIWIQPYENIKFHGLSNWLEGPKDNLLLNSNKYIANGAKLNELVLEHNTNHSKAIRAQEEKLNRKLNRTEKQKLGDSLNIKFITDHPNSFYSLSIIQQKLIGNKNYKEMERLFALLAPEIKQSPTGRFIEKKLEVIPNLEIGKKLPGFELPDLDGKIVKLDNFIGKYVLVDFWASWCIPCRKEFPYLRSIHETYKDFSFDILSISIDSSKDDWKKASQEESLIWSNTTSPGEAQSYLYRLFNLNGVPDNFLLDPDGKIIARNIRAEALKETLDKIFKDD